MQATYREAPYPLPDLLDNLSCDRWGAGERLNTRHCWTVLVCSPAKVPQRRVQRRQGVNSLRGEGAPAIGCLAFPCAQRRAEADSTEASFAKILLQPASITRHAPPNGCRSRLVRSELDLGLTRLRAGSASRRRGADFETSSKARHSRSTATCVVEDLVEAAQIEGLLLEVGHAVGVDGIPQGADHCHQRTLAGAVLAHKEGDRSETGRLLLSEAPVAAHSDTVHRLASQEGHPHSSLRGRPRGPASKNETHKPATPVPRRAVEPKGYPCMILSNRRQICSDLHTNSR